MEFSYNKMIITFFQLVFIIIMTLTASPQSGVVDCRPLLVHEWSSEYGLLWQILINGPAPISQRDPHHP